MSQKYVVAHFFDPQVTAANFSAAAWPLHVTFLPNFTIEWPLAELIHDLNELADAVAPFDITAEGQTAFGLNEDIPVTLIRPDDKVMDLHYKLLLTSHDGSFTYDTPQFINQGFRPHATVQKNNRLHAGQTYRIGDISLVDMYPNDDINRRAIVATFSLKGI